MDVLPRTTTKLCFFALAAIGFILIIVFGRCAMAECLSSAAQVRAEHGVAAWSTWRYVDGHKCYMVGERKVVINDGQRGRSSRISKRLPTIDTRPRPAASPAVAENSASPGLTATSQPGRSIDSETILPAAPTVTCDDNCLRLWESFNILASMERLLSYRVRASAWDEAYTRWASQR
jgi:hypothetical protein